MVTENITYFCGLCGTAYDLRETAEKCEKDLPIYRLEPGDIVTGGSAFGWYDGKKNWITNPNVFLKIDGNKCKNGNGNCFAYCCNYLFYYVVTFVDLEIWAGRITHKPRYHARTLAMTGKQGYPGGYTTDEGHRYLERVKNPPKRVLAESKPLIGWKAQTLL
ncbi:MAG TPA: hypothetical protein ENH82_19750 [bacterium]|nr:hypothetical protein [bacterium]